MKKFAFIFARGGSKGLPGKNLKVLRGKSLLQRAVEVARSAECFEQIFLSTDDAEIAQAGRQLDLEIIDRPQYLADDDSPEWLAWQHAIGTVKKLYGSFDVFVCLPVTSPLREVSDIKVAIAKAMQDRNSICVGMTPSQRSPYFNMVSKCEGGQIQLICQPEEFIPGRQLAPKTYDLTTVIYAANPDLIEKTKALFNNRVYGIEIPKDRAVDIDDIYDFMLADSILAAKENSC